MHEKLLRAQTYRDTCLLSLVMRAPQTLMNGALQCMSGESKKQRVLLYRAIKTAKKSLTRAKIHSYDMTDGSRHNFLYERSLSRRPKSSNITQHHSNVIHRHTTHSRMKTPIFFHDRKKIQNDINYDMHPYFHNRCGCTLCYGEVR